MATFNFGKFNLKSLNSLIDLKKTITFRFIFLISEVFVNRNYCTVCLSIIFLFGKWELTLRGAYLSKLIKLIIYL